MNEQIINAVTQDDRMSSVVHTREGTDIFIEPVPMYSEDLGACYGYEVKLYILNPDTKDSKEIMPEDIHYILKQLNTIF